MIRSVGLRFRDKGAWPLFRSQYPEHLPWFLNQAESALLSTALDQAMAVSAGKREIKGQKTGLILTRCFRDGRWFDEWRKLPQEAPPNTSDDHLDELRLFRLKDSRAERDALWELDCFVLPTATRSRSGPAYFPTCVIAASPRAGVVGARLIGPLPTVLDKQRAVLEIMEESRLLPRSVVMPLESMKGAMQPLAHSLGFSMRISPSLPLIENVLARVL